MTTTLTISAWQSQKFDDYAKSTRNAIRTAIWARSNVFYRARCISATKSEWVNHSSNDSRLERTDTIFPFPFWPIFLSLSFVQIRFVFCFRLFCPWFDGIVMFIIKLLQTLTTASSTEAVKTVSSPSKMPNNRHIIPAESICVNKQLGVGEFGIVQQGVWTNGNERVSIPVHSLFQSSTLLRFEYRNGPHSLLCSSIDQKGFWCCSCHCFPHC